MLLIPSLSWVHQLLWPLVAFHLRAHLRAFVLAATPIPASSWLTQPMKSAIILTLTLSLAVLPPLFPCLRLAQMRFPKRICSPLWPLVRKQLQPSARSRRSLLLSGKRLTALSSSVSTSLTSQLLRSMTASLLTMTR